MSVILQEILGSKLAVQDTERRTVYLIDPAKKDPALGKPKAPKEKPDYDLELFERVESLLRLRWESPEARADALDAMRSSKAAKKAYRQIINSYRKKELSA